MERFNFTFAVVQMFPKVSLSVTYLDKWNIAFQLTADFPKVLKH